MKLIKWLLTVILVLAAVLVLGGYLLSPKFTVTRSVVIAAPPDKVYALIAEPRRWKDWTIWNRRDPSMAIQYSGPPSGVGATWSWQSRTEGEGRMRFTAAEPGQRIAYELYFPDFGTTSTGEVLVAAEGTGSRVTWNIDGDMGANPLMRWFALGADKFIGQDFAAGLSGLRTLAEKP